MQRERSCIAVNDARGVIEPSDLMLHGPVMAEKYMSESAATAIESRMLQPIISMMRWSEPITESSRSRSITSRATRAIRLDDCERGRPIIRRVGIKVSGKRMAIEDDRSAGISSQERGADGDRVHQ